MMTQHLSKGMYLSFPQVIYQGFSLGHQPPLSTGNLPLLVHRPYMYACPHFTYQGLLTDHLSCLVHKPPIRASLQTMYQGLSIGYKLELVHRWWSNTCPEATNQSFLYIPLGLSEGHMCSLVFRLHSKALAQPI